MMTNSHKIGAVFYILWGVIHVLGGVMMMSEAGKGVNSFLVSQTSNEQTVLVDSTVDPNSEGYRAAVGVFTFHAFNILWFGIFAIIVAAKMNWKNSSTGYWLNAAVIACVEIGLIIHVTISGIDILSGPIVGITLFIVALLFSSLGKFSKQPV